MTENKWQDADNVQGGHKQMGSIIFLIIVGVIVYFVYNKYKNNNSQNNNSNYNNLQETRTQNVSAVRGNENNQPGNIDNWITIGAKVLYTQFKGYSDGTQIKQDDADLYFIQLFGHLENLASSISSRIQCFSEVTAHIVKAKETGDTAEFPLAEDALYELIKEDGTLGNDPYVKLTLAGFACYLHRNDAELMDTASSITRDVLQQTDQGRDLKGAGAIITTASCLWFTNIDNYQQKVRERFVYVKKEEEATN